jgi:hypothetical protein
MRKILGQQNFGTLFCLNTQSNPLPKTKDIKRLLNIENFKFYQTNGWYRDDVEKLLRTLDITDTGGKSTYQYHHRGKYRCDHVMFVPEILRFNSMFALRYSEIMVAGFRLSPTSLNTLRDLQHVFFKCVHMHEAAKRWSETANDNNAYILKERLTDPTISDIDFTALAQQMSTYGAQAVEEARSRVKVWYDCHSWNGDTICQTILDDIAASQNPAIEELAAA